MRRILETEVMDTEEEAVAYDQMDNSEPNRNFVERLVELNAHGRMLDMGTGPGHIPLLICQRIADCTVLGIDLAGTMIKLAENYRCRSPYSGRLEFEQADAKKLLFADACFDAVFSNTILHHIPDPRPFLREAWRVLRPGGVLLIRDLFRPPAVELLDELVRLHAGDATPAQRQMFRDSLHAALTPEELRAMAAEAGLRGVEVAIDSDRHMSLQCRAKNYR